MYLVVSITTNSVPLELVRHHDQDVRPSLLHVKSEVILSCSFKKPSPCLSIMETTVRADCEFILRKTENNDVISMEKAIIDMVSTLEKF